ncbi:MAG: hypothetical protein N3E41_06760 [Thermofilaceae archaeon]|nr:hypothetical protein [Thermofilaceae archaeon]
MRRDSHVEGLLKILDALLTKRPLVIYGLPGSLRTRLTLLLCAHSSPFAYVGTGRHSRVVKSLSGVKFYGTVSFYEELLNLFEIIGLVKLTEIKGLALDEFMANLVPYRATLYESYVSRMAFIELQLLKLAAEAGGKVLLVCGEDHRTGGPLGLRYVRQLKPYLIKTSIEKDVLAVEERDIGDPVFVLKRIEVSASEVVSACETLRLG